MAGMISSCTEYVFIPICDDNAGTGSGNNISIEISIPEEVGASDAEIEMPDVGTYKPGDVIESLPTPTIKTPSAAKPNLDFKNWYTNPAGTGDPITFPYTVTEGSDIYAVFDERFPINLIAVNSADPDSDIASVMPEQEGIFRNEKLDEPAAPVAEGYDFGGWFLDAECVSSPAEFPITITEETHLYAKFTPIIPTVSFKAVLIPENTEISVTLPKGYETTIGAEISVPEDLTASGYDFVAWYLDENLENRMPESVEAKAGENVFYAMFVQHEVKMSESPAGEKIIPITYTANVDNPDDVFYVVNEINGGSDKLYITDRINGFPTEIGESAASGEDFTGDVDISVRNIQRQAFESATFGEAWRRKDYNYIFNVKKVDGKGGNIGFSAFWSAKFGTQADSGHMNFTFNQDGDIEDSGIGFTLVDRGSLDATIVMTLGNIDGEVTSGGAHGLVIGSRSKNNLITATITIEKAADYAFASGAVFFDRFEGKEGNLTMTIKNCSEYTMHNISFGDSVDLEDGTVVNINLYGPESVQNGSGYFTPEYLKGLAEDRYFTIDGCTTFKVNDTDILTM